MNNEDNLASYDNVETVQINLSEEALRSYLDAKMESAESNKRFIKENVFCGTPLDVCEIGSGNSKLLYALEMCNVLEGGTGYEVSASRHRLANKFAELLHSQKVRNINANFLDEEPVTNRYDLIVMVDIVFQIIAPLSDTAEQDTLDWIHKSLRDDGILFMEFEDYSNMFDELAVNGGSLRKWEELPEGDPFQYALHLIEEDVDGNLVVGKTHIRRDSNERDYFKNVIKSYTMKKMTALLEKNGFMTKIFPGEFESGEYRGTKRFRVLAQKL